MLIDTARNITMISEDSRINSENYFESLQFIENLFNFINKLKLIIPIKDVSFKPTFKGYLTCEKYGISSSEDENEMRHFIIESDTFLEDKETIEKIKTSFSNQSSSIIIDGKTIEITFNNMNTKRGY